MTLTLTPAELIELTGKQRAPAQARVLQALGVAYRRRPDGSLVVFRAHLNAPQEVGPASPALHLP